MGTLFEDAQQHQLRHWGAQTVGMTYVPGTVVRWADRNGATFNAVDAQGQTHSLRVDYRWMTVAINNGRDEAAIQIRPPAG